MKYKESIQAKKGIIQFVKFGIVGLSNTVIALLVYYGLLVFNVHYLIANIISWAVSVFNAFYWNHKYVFSNNDKWLYALFKTYISYGVSFLLGTVLLFVFVDICKISIFIAPLLTLIVTIPLNFLMNKFWTFR